MKVTLRDVRNIRDWRNIHRLYRRAFPKYERKPFFMILRTRNKGRADVWVIERGGQFAGLAITMTHGDLVLLDYFAVSETLRGSGIGGEALRQFQRIYRGKRLFLEIESTQTDAENLPERIRRKQFYLNNSMSELYVCVDLFGVKMELLGYECTLDFSEYLDLYVHNLGAWAGKHVREMENG